MTGRPARIGPYKERHHARPLEGPLSHPYLRETEVREAAIRKRPVREWGQQINRTVADLVRTRGVEFARIVHWALRERLNVKSPKLRAGGHAIQQA